jgi:hypothetical protein
MLGREEKVSGDVIGSKEEKLFRVSQCIQSEPTGRRIHTTLGFTRRDSLLSELF